MRRSKETACNGGPPQNQGGFVAFAETRPCYRSDERGKYSSCAIRCYSVAFGQQGFGGYYPNAGFEPAKGIGCLVCCILVHENHHCGQFVYKGMEPGADLECGGYTRELERLLRVQQGQRCSG